MAHSERWFASAQTIDWTQQGLDKRSVKALLRALDKSPNELLLYLSKIGTATEAKVRKALCCADLALIEARAANDSQAITSNQEYLLLDDVVDDVEDDDNPDDQVSAPVDTRASADMTPSGYAVHVVASMEERLTVQTTNLLRLLESLTGYQPHSQPFLEPVPRSVPQYHDVITEPMDLSTMRMRVLAGHYGCDLSAFASDLYRIFDNCRLFNESPEARIYVEHANQTQALANHLLMKLPRLLVAREGSVPALSEQLRSRMRRRHGRTWDRAWIADGLAHAARDLVCRVRCPFVAPCHTLSSVCSPGPSC